MQMKGIYLLIYYELTVTFCNRIESQPQFARTFLYYVTLCHGNNIIVTSSELETINEEDILLVCSKSTRNVEKNQDYLRQCSKTRCLKYVFLSNNAYIYIYIYGYINELILMPVYRSNGLDYWPK